MSDSHGLTKENLLFTFPVSLRENPSVAALGNVTAEVLARRPEEIGRISIYPRIDELPEALLDILARDFKVDWWDADCSLEQKRRLLKSSWRVHKKLGTKAAVETAASAVYPYARVQEWFEYGGEPYRFRLDVDLPQDIWTPERHRRLMWQLQYYKSLRSHLDKVIYRMPVIVLQNAPGSFLFRRLRLPFGFRQPQSQREQIGLLFLLREEIRTPETALRFILRSGGKPGEGEGAGGERAALRSLRVPLRAISYGWDMILLDGERLLDGGWLLDQRFRGMAWDAVRFTVPIRERENFSGGLLYGFGAAKETERAGALFQVRSGVREKAGAPRIKRTEIRTACRETNRLTGTVERDTTWRLDGKYQLNGWRVLHEGILREEI